MRIISLTSSSTRCNRRLLDAERTGRMLHSQKRRLDPDLETAEMSMMQRLHRLFGFSVWSEGDHLRLSTVATSVSSQMSRGACQMTKIRVLLPKRKSVKKCENVQDIVTALYRRRSHSRTEASSVWNTPKKQNAISAKIRLRELPCHTICEGRFDSTSLTRARSLSWDVAKSTGRRACRVSEQQVPYKPKTSARTSAMGLLCVKTKSGADL